MLTEDLLFPPPRLSDENGLLAVGGDLSPDRLLLAYEMGIFPWFSEDDPILWWSPDPRLVLFPSKIRVSRSLAKTVRKKKFKITLNKAFEEVIKSCAEVRKNIGEDTWIVGEMQQAYTELHKRGAAHSVEAWFENTLVGGLYGVSVGKAFFGESMFTKMTDASKVAFVSFVNYLNRNSFRIIDCQVRTDHLISLGAEEIKRERFLEIIEDASREEYIFEKDIRL